MKFKKFLSPLALALMVGVAMPAHAHGGHHQPPCPKQPVCPTPPPCPTHPPCPNPPSCPNPPACPTPPPTNAVPEPGSIALVGLGALGLVPLALRARRTRGN